jgi:site-specific recombinase XerD
MSPSLGELAESWLTIVSSRKHSPEWHDNACRSLRKSVLPVFGHLAPEQLSRRDIARFIARMVEEDEHPGKANHVLINLRSVFKWAINTGRLDCANPARDIQRQSLKPRERFLTLAGCRSSGI